MAKERLSNIELLRIISMLFVLFVHANFLSFGAPEISDLSNPISVFGRYLAESLAICCVDVFVLISGWFGIHYNLAKLGTFLFQVLFFSLGIFIIVLFVSPNRALTREGLKSIFLFNGSDYWFIKAYLILMIIAPMLNSFVEHASIGQFRLILGSYLAVMWIYGWLEPGSVNFTMNGYTALSFIGLYLIGRYLRLCPPPIIQASST